MLVEENTMIVHNHLQKGYFTASWAWEWAHGVDCDTTVGLVDSAYGSFILDIAPSGVNGCRCATIEIDTKAPGLRRLLLGSVLLAKDVDFLEDSRENRRVAEVVLFSLLSSVRCVDARENSLVPTNWQQVVGHRYLLAAAYAANCIRLNDVAPMIKARRLP